MESRQTIIHESGKVFREGKQCQISVGGTQIRGNENSWLHNKGVKDELPESDLTTGAGMFPSGD